MCVCVCLREWGEASKTGLIIMISTKAPNISASENVYANTNTGEITNSSSV